MSVKSGSEVSPDIVPIGDDSFRLTKSVKKPHKRYRKHKPSVTDEAGGSVVSVRSKNRGESRERKREKTVSERGNRRDDDGGSSRMREEKRRRHEGTEDQTLRDKGSREVRSRGDMVYDRERIKRREERFHGRGSGVESRRSRSPIPPRSRYDHHYHDNRQGSYRPREGRSSPGYRGGGTNMDTRKRSKGTVPEYRRRESVSISDSDEDARHRRKRPRGGGDDSERVYVRSLIQDLEDSHSSSSSFTSDSEGTPGSGHTPRGRRHTSRSRGHTPGSREHTHSRSPVEVSQGYSDDSRPKIKSWKDIAEASSDETDDNEDHVDSDNKDELKFSQMSESFLKYSEAVSSSDMEEGDNEGKPSRSTSDHTPSGQPSQMDTSDIAEGQRQEGEDGGGDDDKEEKMEDEEDEGEQLPPYLPALMGCRSVECFEWLNKIEEGTYGVVFRAKERRTGEVVALKKLKMEKEREGFPITSLREINMLLKASHPNIVHVREIVVGSNMDKIYIVMDYVEHDLKSLMEVMKQPFLEGEVKTLMIQLLRAVHHMHDNWILHRDLKTSNLLLSHKGILKVADFGLAREYGSPLKKYTPIVVTLWYRCPELLLGAKEYSTAVDVWSVGCIFAELLNHKPLFMGKSEIDQLNQIFKELGTPSNDIWPGYSELPVAKKVSFSNQPMNNLRKRFPVITNIGFNLLNKLLTYDPKRRITAEDALQHGYFEESPLPVDPSMFPTWPAKSEMVKKPRQRSPSAPEGGAFLLNKLKEKDDPEEVKHRSQAASKASGFTLKF